MQNLLSELRTGEGDPVEFVSVFFRYFRVHLSASLSSYWDYLSAEFWARLCFIKTSYEGNFSELLGVYLWAPGIEEFEYNCE